MKLRAPRRSARESMRQLSRRTDGPASCRAVRPSTALFEDQPRCRKNSGLVQSRFGARPQRPFRVRPSRGQEPDGSYDRVRDHAGAERAIALATKRNSATARC